MGFLKSIYIAPEKGKPMEFVMQADLITGGGIIGDRYDEDAGSFSNSKRQAHRYVTLIEDEAITAANLNLDIPFIAEETRRNLLTQGVNLNIFYGKEFHIGNVALEGVDYCPPCDRPNRSSGKIGFDTAFADRGGLWARVLSGGHIIVGDTID